MSQRRSCCMQGWCLEEHSKAGKRRLSAKFREGELLWSSNGAGACDSMLLSGGSGINYGDRVISFPLTIASRALLPAHVNFSGMNLPVSSVRAGYSSCRTTCIYLQYHCSIGESSKEHCFNILYYIIHACRVYNSKTYDVLLFVFKGHSSLAQTCFQAFRDDTLLVPL